MTFLPRTGLAGMFALLFLTATTASTAEELTTTPPPGSDAAAAAAGRMPEPVWVTRELFERQLDVVHGKVRIDPAQGLFGPHSMMWQVSRYMAPGGLGAGRALLLQISHPWVTAGIDEHSITRDDPLKRGRNTFRYILTMIYGTRDQALDAARDVRIIHEKIQGHMRYRAGAFAEGSEYRANEVQAMLWVHATLWETLMLMYEQSVGPVSARDKERYYQETKLFAYLFGIPEEALPATWDDFLQYCANMRESGMLAATPASRELAGFLFGVKGVGPFLWLPMQYQKVVTASNLPEDLREGYGFGYGPVRKGLNKTVLFSSRVGHKILPDAMLYSPVHKEAVARLRHKRASAYTRFQLRVLFGQPQLTNEL